MNSVMQAKKPQYEIYQSMMDTELKHLNGHLKNKLGKGPSRSDLLAELFKFMPQFATTLALHIYAEEFYWMRTGGHTIFPASAQILNSLYETPIGFSAIETFNLPHQSFMLSIPAGYAVDGVKVPSFLVTCIPYHKTQELITSPFARLAQQHKGITIRLEESPAHDVAISIAYRDPAVPSAYARTQFSVAQLPELLGIEGHATQESSLKKYPRYSDVDDLSDHDVEIQRTMMRLVAALAWHTSNRAGSLKEGFPFQQIPKMVGRLPEKFTPMTLMV
jgi:hypothetical protein